MQVLRDEEAGGVHAWVSWERIYWVNLKIVFMDKYESTFGQSFHMNII